MKQVEIMYCHAQDDFLTKKYKYFLSASDMSDYGYICIGPVEVEYEIPETNLIQAQVDALQKELATVITNYASARAEIEDRLAKLRSLEYVP